MMAASYGTSVPDVRRELPMTSAPVRDPLADHLITPQKAAFLFIDYQPSQLATIRSMDPALLLKNAVSTVRTIKAFGVPVVHSTVLLGGRRVPPGRPCDRAQETRHLHPLDRGLHGLYRGGRAARRV
jgi:hypothetical protein